VFAIREVKSDGAQAMSGSIIFLTVPSLFLKVLGAPSKTSATAAPQPRRRHHRAAGATAAVPPPRCRPLRMRARGAGRRSAPPCAPANPAAAVTRPGHPRVASARLPCACRRAPPPPPPHTHTRPACACRGQAIRPPQVRAEPPEPLPRHASRPISGYPALRLAPHPFPNRSSRRRRPSRAVEDLTNRDKFGIAEATVKHFGESCKYVPPGEPQRRFESTQNPLATRMIWLLP
jgi:hypothetical protein